MGDRYLFIKEAHLASEELYLRYAGAGDSVNSEDILERMAELSKPLLGGKTVPDEWLRVLWDRLEPMSRTVEGEQAARYRSLITYPVNGGHVRPMRIVLLAGQNQQIFPSGGWYGQWYALPETLSHHRATLRALGAKSSDQLSAKEIREIIESVCADGKPMSPTAADTVVRLLLVLGKLSPYRDIANAAIWPAVSKGTVSLRRLDECLIRDHPAAAQFENEVSLLYDPSDWKLRADFRWLAVACGGSSRLFSQAVQTEYSHSTAQVPDDGLAARLRLMAYAIRSAFPGACVAAPESINWLRKISVFRSDRLELRVRVGRIERRVETPCVIIPEDGKSKILRVGFDPSLRDSLASALVDELERQGFPVDSESGVDTASRVTRSELGLLIYRLLTRDPSEWHFFVRDLEPIREWVPPILDEEAETRQGYAEVRQSLLELYGCCQICGRRTPAAEGARDSCETVRSIVSMKGGRYPGYFDEYVLGNSLFLCPSHQTLYVRRLVKLPDLDKARAMGREGAQRLRTMAKLIDTPDIQVDVYETPEAGNFPPRWQSRTLSLKSEHGREIMNWLADWVERVANERT